MPWPSSSSPSFVRFKDGRSSRRDARCSVCDEDASAKLRDMEQLEAWLQEHGIEITGQVATGSGDLLRLRIRLPDSSELDVVLSGVTLLERPQDAIETVRQSIADHEAPQQHSRSNGHT